MCIYACQTANRKLFVISDSKITEVNQTNKTFNMVADAQQASVFGILPAIHRRGNYFQAAGRGGGGAPDICRCRS